MGRTPKICMSLIWLIILIFFVWPIAFFVAPLWLILQPFEACFQVLRSVNNFLERMLTWPRSFGQAIMSGTTSCPHP
eukprot:Nitzschia sp. Nitz4//scaffold61_size107673//356//662//NITZ4_004216-RA/size107673-snap-gene-0.42-mRNA-1//1//CDS//3329555653//5327//frame0